MGIGFQVGEVANYDIVVPRIAASRAAAIDSHKAEFRDKESCVVMDAAGVAGASATEFAKLGLRKIGTY